MAQDHKPQGCRLGSCVSGGGTVGTGGRALAFLAAAVLLSAPLGLGASALAPAQTGGSDVAQGDDADPWWRHFSRDRDGDRIDDELQWQLGRAASGDAPVSLIVDYDRRPGEADREGLRRAGASVTLALQYLDSVVVRAPPSRVDALRSLAGVVMLEAAPAVELELASAVPSTTVPAVWSNSSLYGDGVVIAVVDTGIDRTHAGLNDLDDVNDTDDPKIVAFYDAAGAPDNVSGSDLAYDQDGHGSHVSGIAAGTGAPDFLNVGVAPQARLVGVRIGGDTISNDDAMRGMEWVISNRLKFGITIMSLSFGTRLNAPGITNDGNSAISRLADEAVDAGLIVTVAAGNKGPQRRSIAPPGDAHDVITVGNVDDNGLIAPSSSRGPVGSFRDSYIKPDVCAPGTDITSVDANTLDKYVSAGGTSMSTPFVAGVAALAMQASPTLTPGKLKQLITSTAGGESVGLLGQSPNNDYGYGTVDPKALLDTLTADGGGPPTVTMETPPPPVAGTVTLRGTASSPEAQIAAVEVRVGSGPFVRADGTTGWRYSWNTTATPNGPVLLFARSYDGSTYSGVARVQVTVDNLLVTIDGFEGPTKGIYRAVGTATGVSITAVEVQVDAQLWTKATKTGTDWSSWGFDLDPKGLKAGDHVLRARALTAERASPLAVRSFAITANGSLTPDPSGPGPTPDPGPGPVWGILGQPLTVLLLAGVVGVALLGLWRSRTERGGTRGSTAPAPRGRRG